MTLQQLKEQIEFYFSDSNYAKDKFMNARASDNDGFIAIPTIHTFKRLHALDATVESVKEAIKDSTVVELKEDSIRKVITQEFKDYLNDSEVTKRVIYIKGFPSDISLDEIREVLSKHFVPVKVTLRRDMNKSFKGSCFVELESKEKAEEALALKIEAPAIGRDEETSKKQRTEPEFLEILSRDQYYGKNKEDKGDSKFASRVKENFIPRLFKMKSDQSFDVKEAKAIIPNCAFVDTQRNVVRMKFIEEWDEKEFEFPKSEEKEAFTVKLSKMTDEEAREYLKNINIKKTGKGGRRN